MKKTFDITRIKPVNITRIAAVFILMVVLVSGCRKIGINGDLDGQWRVLSIENTATGEYTEPTNLFYCLYLHTVNLTGSGTAAGNMTYIGNILTLEFPVVENVSVLHKWGIYSIRTEFRVERLTSSHMVLVSDQARLTLQKF